MIQECQNGRRIEVVDGQRRRCLSSLFFDETEQQLERIAITRDGLGTHTPLIDEPFQEEILK
jgi:hypothetical protein